MSAPVAVPGGRAFYLRWTVSLRSMEVNRRCNRRSIAWEPTAQTTILSDTIGRNCGTTTDEYRCFQFSKH